MGHIENVCSEPPPLSKKGKSDQKTEDIQSGSICNVESDADVRLPIESVNIEEGPCLTLWDTGSMLNLVSSTWISRKGLEGKDCNLQFKVVDSGV